jgi:hypothetical protein
MYRKTSAIQKIIGKCERVIRKYISTTDGIAIDRFWRVSRSWLRISQKSLIHYGVQPSEDVENGWKRLPSGREGCLITETLRRREKILHPKNSNTG